MKKPNAWLALVKATKKKYPKKSFKEVLKLCSTLYKKKPTKKGSSKGF